MKREEVNREELSPMMRQYMEIKDEHLDELLFFRLGDFYELFFEDAILCSHELELTLTGKNAGLKERIPMCGVPFHSVKPYIEKLVTKGYKVAICEQLEDPKTVKGMVKRGVIDIVSKATLVDLDYLNANDFAYIGSLTFYKYTYVLSYTDISTGKLFVKLINPDINKVINEILKVGIKELIITPDIDEIIKNTLKNNYNIDVYSSNDYLENEYTYLLNNIDNIAIKASIKHLLYYLVVKEMKNLSHIKNVEIINNDDYLEMDVHTVRNLELFETLRMKERTYSLIWLLDKTKTAMGSRKLKEWLKYPLKDIKLINDRYDQIDTINKHYLEKDELKALLFEVYDIERLCGKIICGNVNARDLLQMKNSLKVFPKINEITKIMALNYQVNPEEDIYNLLEKAIYEDAPITLKDGYLIKKGYNEELDELKRIRSGGKDFIAELEQKEKENTKIKNLRIGYNKVFGYYIEISKGQVGEVLPEFGWERKQTLANCERYISPILKEKETEVLNAEEKIIEIEYRLFMDIKEEVKKHIFDLQESAKIISELDAIVSLATVAEENSFVRPLLTADDEINIIEGKHPVIDKVMKNEYISNDCYMSENIKTLLITGPNMSGKSTYMRQLAMIIIMAQMGSFVPTKSAKLKIFDKIFTRIGASDDLVSGESTFMVEMLEARNAIANATKDSLILFDELGRGTATYDGMSLAEAILEYVNNNIKCKTLFSTHYHELTSMDENNPGIKNIHVEAHEENGTITFLHKIVDGAVDKSYGIHVASLANMPKEIILRAQDILKFYETTNTDKEAKQITLPLNIENNDNILKEELAKINTYEITPIEALNILNKLKEKSENL